MNRLKNNYKEYLVVFLGWLLLGVIMLLFGKGMAEELSVEEFVGLYCTYFFLFLLILYLNSLVLLPKLYYASKKVAYFLIMLLLGLLVVFYFKPFGRMVHEIKQKTKPYWENKIMKEIQASHGFKDSMVLRFRNQLPPPPPPHGATPDGRGPGGPPPFPNTEEQHPDFVSLIIFLFLIGSGLAIESNRRLTQSEQKRILAEAEKTKAELSFLKAQVNPHFLFNTLNNIYSMSLVQKEETPDAIMRLSNIMRYVTESSDVEVIGLSDEIDFITDYIYLNELKGGRQLELIYQVNGNPNGKEIAPLLLISFIENAFKYGISKRERSPIGIQIDITEGLLKMVVTNKIFKSRDEISENTGIGIENARRRLETLYTGKYRLDIVKKEEEFIVNLDVPLVINERDEEN